MYVLINHRDSFVHTIAAYFRELGQKIIVIDNDRCAPPTLKRLSALGALEGIVLSPGPGSPADYGRTIEILTCMEGAAPILGICLGHQIIGYGFGAKIEKGAAPMHGKTTRLHHSRKGLFENLPQGYEATRYHSLVVSDRGFPECLRVDALSEDGAIMAISHNRYPIYGIQYHPEAALTQYGHELLGNFIALCQGNRQGKVPA